METEYVTFKPPRLAAVRMTRGPVLLASFAGAWRFEDAGPGLTRVTFRYHIKARPHWLWPLLAAVFRRDTERRLRALKRAAENAAGAGGVAGQPDETQRPVLEARFDALADQRTPLSQRQRRPERNA